MIVVRAALRRPLSAAGIARMPGGFPLHDRAVTGIVSDRASRRYVRCAARLVGQRGLARLPHPAAGARPGRQVEGFGVQDHQQPSASRSTAQEARSARPTGTTRLLLRAAWLELYALLLR
ncbi:hypothetical protein IQ251_12315 [Saccharopolyspora sp. HNM0983]|uniref:Uncharacterized protein n=1 Tax=Saccharopolyspora montiporae TaxID=2781240 RepID=A0A929B8K1_9PSEU|nr:hypothetical protein [Saccharopolyspora sp. HNM0983]MBE9375227.1 hypothetical protein [Saccharopolyspora sp. HNM0983]